MNFSRLDQNEKLAVYGAAASIIGPLIATAVFGIIGVGWLTLVLALAMLAIVFLPQLSPQTTLPGSKGSLMLVVGGIAAIGALLSILTGLGLLGILGIAPLVTLGWLIGIAGGLLMGWAGWQEFQAEGGQFQLGSAAPTADSTTTRPNAGSTTTRPNAGSTTTRPNADHAAPRADDATSPSDSYRAGTSSDRDHSAS